MTFLIWTGAAITLLGTAWLVACIVMALRAKRRATDDQALRARLQWLVAMNLVGVMISAIGLMAVVAGILLG